VDGKFEVRVTTDAPPTVTERLDDVLVCQFTSCGVNFRMKTLVPALRGCAAVFTVKLSAKGGVPRRLDVAIAVPLSNKLTIPVGAGPASAVVNCPAIANGVPDATMPNPLLPIDKAVDPWTTTPSNVPVADQLASPE
jgi:hypothetical protein